MNQQHMQPMQRQMQYTSERIDDLPVQNHQMNPTEYAKIAPLLRVGSEVTATKENRRSIKKYIFTALLFTFVSISLFDKIILGVIPSLENFTWVLTIVKSVIFVIGLYILDNMIKG